MNRIGRLEDIDLLRESLEVECKLAAGQDGKGAVPKDFWPTYSAFANTHGGLIVLGVQEKPKGVFTAVGVANPDRLRRELFDQANNREKISANLLTDAHVEAVSVDGNTLLVVEIPAATRKNKPVHLNGNPMTGTYRRLNEGDRLCDGETVRRMLAEQMEDKRDDRILAGYGLKDLDFESIRIYRQQMRDRKPDHPYLDLDDMDFLRRLRCWREDREISADGLTVAGLLMFGHADTIRDEFPGYNVDYQERPRNQAEQRWIDRITPDGTWSGNLFDFYRRVYRKLVADLKVPFDVKNGVRQDETQAHEAIREALVNALVHADYSGRASIFVVKRPDMFGFRNPGLMRIPPEYAMQGGESDCRNPALQNMFLLIGAAERAGSGVPKIFKGWEEQHWRPPKLYEKDEPSDQTLLELRMIDLFPDNVRRRLQERFGSRFNNLSQMERIILATALIEGRTNHTRLMGMCDLHSADLTRNLQSLVDDGFLTRDGRRRGASYSLPDRNPAVGAFLGSESRTLGSESRALGSEFSGLGSEFLTLPSENSDARASERQDADLPADGSLKESDPETWRILRAIAEPAIDKGRIEPERMKDIILKLCQGRSLTIRILSELLDRKPDYLRQRILKPMILQGLLEYETPQSPNSPRQAYRTKKPENA